MFPSERGAEVVHKVGVKVLTTQVGYVGLTSKIPPSMVKRETSNVLPPRSKVRTFVKSRFVFFHGCRLDASHHCLVVNKDPPFVAVHFVVFVVVPVARIHRTRGPVVLSSFRLVVSLLALAVRTPRTRLYF